MQEADDRPMKQLLFETSQGEVVARVIQDKNVAITQEVAKCLPLSSKVETWGEEIYFETSIAARVQEPQEIVDLGDVGYWPPGRALCLFFGKTPISSENEIRPASAVGVFAQLIPPFEVLKQVQSGEKIKVRKLN
ncbi:MAG: cyclophilin-like family protein [Candidatus Hodarchaeota archaeon]